MDPKNRGKTEHFPNFFIHAGLMPRIALSSDPYTTIEIAQSSPAVTEGSKKKILSSNQINSNQIKFYLVTHNTYYVHFITSVVTEEIL